MHDERTTWHYGLMARWWAEFNRPAPPDDPELAFYRGRVVAGAGPALDVGCGSGRLLIPLVEAGLEVDGTDISADMIDVCRAIAAEHGLTPRLRAEAAHDLDTGHRYRTIFLCGSFGIGSTREQDRAALQRCHEHLDAGGTLVLNKYLPYADPRSWRYWTPAASDRTRDGELRRPLPRDWPRSGDRRRTGDGEELELMTRLVGIDALEQRVTLGCRLRHFVDRELVREEESELHETLYLRNEMLLLLEMAGFAEVEVLGDYDGSAPSAESAMLVFVARR